MAFDASKIFVGMAMLVTNMGVQFAIKDYREIFNELMTQSPLIRRFVIICMFYVGTRDLMVSVILTFALMVVLDGIINKELGDIVPPLSFGRIPFLPSSKLNS